jgi:hypothetical protein
MAGLALTRLGLGRWSRSRRNQIVLLHQQCTEEGGGGLPMMFNFVVWYVRSKVMYE